MRIVKKLAIWAGGVLAVGAVAFFLIAPGYTEKQQNGLAQAAILPAKDERHAQYYVADLHIDSLLWKRDLSKQANRGHADLPRLRAGNVALQVFSATTKSPAGLNNVRNDAAARDNITLLAIGQLWPVDTWRSIFARADYQLQKLRNLAAEHPEQLVLIETSADLAAHRQRYEQGSEQIAALYLIEGAHPLEGNIENLDRLFDSGLRIAGLTHFFDNEVADSLHGLRRGGLTEFGRQVVRRANELGVIIDIAHASPQTVRDVLALSSKPTILSHGGMVGHCPTPRNLDDELMKAFAEAGGLLGIGFWKSAVCDPSPRGIASAIDYAVKTLGVDHVALGSDFDGAVTTTFDVSRLDLITSELFVLGYSEKDVAKVLGENAYQFFLDNLPGR